MSTRFQNDAYRRDLDAPHRLKDVLVGFAFSALFWVVVISSVAMALRACAR